MHDFTARRKADFGGVILFRIGRNVKDSVMFLADKVTFLDRIVDAIIDHVAKHGVSAVLNIQVQCGHLPDSWYNLQGLSDEVIVVNDKIERNAKDVWHYASAVVKNHEILNKFGRDMS